MKFRFWSPTKVLCTGIAALMLGGCAASGKTPVFNPKTCLQQASVTADKVEIIKGARTKLNVASDMHPVYCNGQVLLKLMTEKGKSVNPGTVWFHVSVEYTGEVVSARIANSEIHSKEFLKQVSDMIMDLDFTPWQRQDNDTEFIYPMTFYRWWN